MNDADLRAALQQESLTAVVSPDAAAQLPDRVRRRVRRRRSAQAGGLGVVALIVAGVTLAAGPGSHRSSSTSLGPAPSPSPGPVPSSTSGLAVVLRPDGLWVNGPGGLALVPDTKAATSLGLSMTGRYVSWLHTDSAGSGHAYVWDTQRQRLADLGTANGVSWDPAADRVVRTDESGTWIEVPAPEQAGGLWFTATRVSAAASYATVWRPTGGEVLVQSRGPLLLLDARGDVPSVTAVPGVPDDTIPAAWTGDHEFLAWPDAGGSASIAADGLVLRTYPLDPAASVTAHDVATTLPYSDWIQLSPTTGYLLSGGDRVAAHGKELRYIGADPDRALPSHPAGTTVTSIALDPQGATLAQVVVPTEADGAGALPTQGQVLISSTDGSSTVTVPGITDARAVERAPGGWLVIGASELHEVYDDGTVKDLGLVDGQTSDYYGHVPPSWVVLPTRD